MQTAPYKPEPPFKPKIDHSKTWVNLRNMINRMECPTPEYVVEVDKAVNKIKRKKIIRKKMAEKEKREHEEALQCKEEEKDMQVELNLINAKGEGGALKVAAASPGNKRNNEIFFRVLMDSGSSHSIIAGEVFDKYFKNISTTPCNYSIQVAGKKHERCIKRKANILLSFLTTEGNQVEIRSMFNIVEPDIRLNYQIIVGTNLMHDVEISKCITSSSWEVYENGVPKAIRLEPAEGVYFSAFCCANYALRSQSITTVSVMTFGDIAMRFKGDYIAGFRNVLAVSKPLRATEVSNIYDIDITNMGSEDIFLSVNQPLIYEWESPKRPDTALVPSSDEPLFMWDGKTRDAYVKNKSFDPSRENRLFPLSRFDRGITEWAKQINTLEFYGIICINDKIESDQEITLNLLDQKIEKVEKIYERVDKSKILPEIGEEIIGEKDLLPSKIEGENNTYRDVSIHTSVDNNTKNEVINVLKRAKDCFSKSSMDIGSTDYYVADLKFESSKLVKEKQRNFGNEKTKQYIKLVDDLEKAGVVEEYSFNTPKAISNAVLIQKNAGRTKAEKFRKKFEGNNDPPVYRMTIDARMLNRALQTVPVTQVPIIDDVLQDVQGKIVSTFDLCQAFFSVKITERSKPYLCFWCNNRIYTFKRLLQGLKSAPSIFMNVAQLVFSKEKLIEITKKAPHPYKNILSKAAGFEDFLKVYVDDLFVYSITIEEHIAHLYAVLEAILISGLKVSPKKCSLFAKEFRILGVLMNVDKNQIGIDQIKAQGILDWPRPVCISELHSRICALRYNARFFPNFNDTIFPLLTLIRENKWKWTDVEEAAWHQIKSNVIADIRTTIAHRNEKLVLHFDASKVALSGCLFVARGGKLKPVGFYSKLLSVNDIPKAAFIKELYSFIHCLKHFETTMNNSKFPTTVYTDAKSLVYLARKKSVNVTATAVQHQLLTILDRVRVNVYHVPSQINYLADQLSRSMLDSRFVKGEVGLGKYQASLLPPVPRGTVLTEKLIKSLIMNDSPEEVFDGGKTTLQVHQDEKDLEDLENMFFQHQSPEDIFHTSLGILLHWNQVPIEKRFQVPRDTYILDQIKSNDVHNLRQALSELVNEYQWPKDKNPRASAVITREYCTKQVDFLMSNCFDLIVNRKLRSKVRQALIDNLLLVYRDQEKNITEVLENNTISHNVLWVSENEPVLHEINLQYTGKIMGNVESGKVTFVEDDQFIREVKVCYEQSDILPQIDAKGQQIFLKAQKTLVFPPFTTTKIDSKVSLVVPRDYVGEIDSFHKDMEVCAPNIIAGDVNTIMLYVYNRTQEFVTVKVGETLARVSLVLQSDVNKRQRKDYRQLISNYICRMGPEKTSTQYRQLNQLQNILCTEDFPNTNNSSHDKVAINLEEVNLEALPPIQINNLYIFGLRMERECPDNNFDNVLNNGILNTNNEEDVVLDETERSLVNQNLMTDQIEKLSMLETDIINKGFLTVESVRKFQEDDLFCIRLIREAKEETGSRFFLDKNKVLYRRGNNNDQIVVPDLLLPAIIDKYHKSLLHASISATTNAIAFHFYHRKLRGMVQKYLHSCLVCAYIKPYTHFKLKPGSTRSFIPEKPRDYWFLDIVPMYKAEKFNHILIAVDGYSAYVSAWPLQTKSTPAITEALRNLMCQYGRPRGFYADNEISLVSALGSIAKNDPGIETMTSSSYSHWQNTAEASIKVFKRDLKMFLNLKNLKSEWNKTLYISCSNTNRAPLSFSNSDIRTSRAEIFFGVEEKAIFDPEGVLIIDETPLPGRVLEKLDKVK